MHSGNENSPASTTAIGAALGGRSRELVLAQLDAISGSPQFLKSARRRDILRHLVLLALDGRTDSITSASIAEAVYGRQHSDAHDDPLVRVEVSRLRNSLDEYYATAGLEPPVRISIPKGQYVPLFHFVKQVGEVAAVVEAPSSSVVVRHPRRGIVAAVLLVAAFAGLWFVRPRAPEIVRVTSVPGRQRQPTVSPDGRMVAFVWDGDRGQDDIFVTDISGQGPIRRVTNGPTPNVSPAWSPDGRFIAFLRRASAATRDVYVVASDAVPGAPERLVLTLHTAVAGLEWTRDSHSLIVCDSEGGQPLALYTVGLSDGSRRRLTETGLNAYQAAVSPDGRTLAFAADQQNNHSAVYLLPLSEKLEAAGPARILESTVSNNVTTPRWSRDGKYVFFTRLNTGAMRVPVGNGREVGGVAEAVPGVPPRSGSLQEYAPGSYLYSRNFAHDFLATMRSEAAPVPLFQTVAEDTAPDLSPDGRRVAFTSTRSGRSQLWIANADGTGALRIPTATEPFAPRWSPDAKQIVFSATPVEGHPRIYLASVADASVQSVRPDDADNQAPFFSRDGRWIYYSSNRNSKYQIWRVSRSGGPPEKLTEEVAVAADEAPDGKSLYYNSKGRIFRLPFDTREPKLIFDDKKCNAVRATAAGVYIQTESANRGPLVRFYAYGADEPAAIFLPGGTFQGWCPLPDGGLLFGLHRGEAHLERCRVR